jgi:hypothetical protein
MFVAMSEMCKLMCQVRKILSEENTTEKSKRGMPDLYGTVTLTCE